MQIAIPALIALTPIAAFAQAGAPVLPADVVAIVDDPTLPRPMAPYVLQVKAANLGAGSTGVAGAEQDWYKGTFEWRFTLADGSPLAPNDRVSALDLQGNTVYMDTDQRAWNAACWLPEPGLYRASVRYRNAAGLYSAWAHSPPVGVGPNGRGKIYCRAFGFGISGASLAPWEAVPTLEAAIDLIDPGATPPRTEIVISGQDGPVPMEAARYLLASNIYIHHLGDVPWPREVVLNIPNQDAAFTLGDMSGPCTRLVIEGLDFVAGQDQMILCQSLGNTQTRATVQSATNTAFVNCTHAGAPGQAFSIVWNSTEGHNAWWEGLALINCDARTPEAVNEFTVYGLANAWTIWGSSFSPTAGDFTATCRLTWAPYHWTGDQGASEYVSIQYSDFDFGSNQNIGSVMRSYVGRYFMANNSAFRRGAVTIAQADDEHTPTPNNVLDHKFSRCAFEFTADGGDFVLVRQGAARVQFDGCSFTSEDPDTPVFEMQPWISGSAPDEPIRDVCVINCTFERTAPFLIYDEIALTLGPYPVPDCEGIEFGNNLFVVPETMGTKESVHFNILGVDPASRGYRLRRNVYRSDLQFYAAVNGQPLSWLDWNFYDPGVSPELLAGEESQYSTWNPVMLAPGSLRPFQSTPSGELAVADPTLAGGIYSWNTGTLAPGRDSYFPLSTSANSWVGVWQPTQDAVTLLGAPAPTHAVLSWSGAAAAGYWVHYGTKPGESLWQTTTTSTGITIPLNPGTYYFRVMAYNAASSLSPESNEVAVVIPFAACYPDCNSNGTLTIADFACFQTKFAGADPYADCNTSGNLSVADFACFQTRFVVGCP